MQLEKHCVTVDILLHWFYRMIVIIHYTNIFSLGSGFVHVFMVLCYSKGCTIKISYCSMPKKLCLCLGVKTTFNSFIA